MSNKTETMNTKYLPLLQVIQEINSESRHPTDRIQAFWNKYGINDSRLYILNMILAFKGENINTEISTAEMEKFSRDLIEVLLAYYVLQHEKVSLDLIDMSIPENEEEFGYEEMLNACLDFSIRGRLNV